MTRSPRAWTDSGTVARLRRRLHRAYVGYLSAQDDQNAPPELRARHLQEAGDTLAAVHAWERAGDRSSEGAQAEAACQYKHAIDLYASLGVNDQSERYEFDVLLKLGQAQVGVVGGAAPETASTFRRAAELSERIWRRSAFVLWAARG